MKTKLSGTEIEKLDPYQFMAALGKKIIHPGGKKSTKELYAMAELQPHFNVLEIGCGVGSTAIDIVKRFGCNITITDIDDNMIAQAMKNIRDVTMEGKIKVLKADIQQLPFEDNSFDVVIIEAVTMFVNREKAVAEVMRVCKVGGKILEHEFIWRKKPTQEARKIFEGEVCPGIKFDTAEDWIRIYEKCGLKNSAVVTGPFRMMSIKGFLQDEGFLNTMSIMAKTFSRIAYLKKMMWLMPRIMKVKNSLGYIVFTGMK
jgi:SAM-dependent methyltransferase